MAKYSVHSDFQVVNLLVRSLCKETGNVKQADKHINPQKITTVYLFAMQWHPYDYKNIGLFFLTITQWYPRDELESLTNRVFMGWHVSEKATRYIPALCVSILYKHI